MCKRRFSSVAVVVVLAVLSQAAVVQGVLLEGRVLEGDPPDETKPIEGVTVDLYGSNNQADKGTRIATTTTDPAGRYELPVPASPAYDYYNIVEQQPADYPVSVDARTIDGVKIDNNWIQYVGLAGKNLIGNKFWDKKSQPPPPQTGTISGIKFNDLNENGRKDNGEPGIPGWEITLTDNDGTVLATTTTNRNGEYQFDNLEPGTYGVSEEGKKDWFQTFPAEKHYSGVRLSQGEVLMDMDFGNHWTGIEPPPAVTLSGWVYEDTGLNLCGLAAQL